MDNKDHHVEAVAVKTISLNDLDHEKKSEQAFEFEYVPEATGKGSGIFLSVIGSQSSKVQGFLRKQLNDKRARIAMAAKRGKELPSLIEEDEEFTHEAAAVRLVGWRGITEPFNHDNALFLVTKNAEIRSQVFENSNNLANFTKG